jgi:TDG/mug DNA glycosylase family protein
LTDVVTRPAAGLARQDLAACHGQELADLIAPGVQLLWVAINPGLWSAAVQAHFAHPANRFWPALFQGRIIDRPIRVSTGMSASDRGYFTSLGMGITSLVSRATATPADLSAADLRAGRRRLATLVKRHEPRVVAVCGIVEYQIAAGRRDRIIPGIQRDAFGGAELWVVPNPSVTNNEVNIRDLAAAYRAAATSAGIVHSRRRASNSW